MAFTTLKDDLLAEFRDERIMLNDQLELLDPLSVSLRRPAAQKLLSGSTLLLTEYACYLASLGGIAFAACMHLIFPFSLLRDSFYNSSTRNNVGAANLMYLTLAVYGIVLLATLLIFFIGRMAREIRLKNEIIDVTGKEVKSLMGLVLERKAAADTIEQRHMLSITGINHLPRHDAPVASVPNPGY